jgi:long-subunit fatty acid transport protein
MVVATRAFCQSLPDSLPPASSTENQEIEFNDNGESIRKPSNLNTKKLQTNFTIGSSFTTTSGYGSGLTNFISPTLSYRVNPRLSFRAGITISNTFLFDYQPWFSNETFTPYDANFTQALVFVEGSYLVTPKLRLTGGAFKLFTIDDNSPSFNPYTTNEPYGFYLNADYEIKEGMHFQAGFSYTKGINPYRYSPLYDPSPFQGSFMPTPYARDPFYQPFGW